MVAAIRLIESSGAVILVISEGVILVIVIHHSPLSVTLVVKVTKLRTTRSSPVYVHHDCDRDPQRSSLDFH